MTPDFFALVRDAPIADTPEYRRWRRAFAELYPAAEWRRWSRRESARRSG